MTRDYAYFIENRLRERYRLEGVPTIIDFVERNERRPASDREERRSVRERRERRARAAPDAPQSDPTLRDAAA